RVIHGPAAAAAAAAAPAAEITVRIDEAGEMELRRGPFGCAELVGKRRKRAEQRRGACADPCERFTKRCNHFVTDGSQGAVRPCSTLAPPRARPCVRRGPLP